MGEHARTSEYVFETLCEVASKTGFNEQLAKLAACHLMDAGIEHMDELRATSLSDLSRIDGIGPLSMDLLREVLGKKEDEVLDMDYANMFQDSDGNAISLGTMVRVIAPNNNKVGLVDEISFLRNGSTMVKVEGSSHRVNAQYVHKFEVTEEEMRVDEVLRKYKLRLNPSFITEFVSDLKGALAE